MNDKTQLTAISTEIEFTPVTQIFEVGSTQSQLDVVEAFTSVDLIPGSIKGAMTAAGAGSRDLWQVDPFKIHVIEGLNPRIMTESYKAHIRALADSMKTEGFYQDQPLAGYTVKRDGILLVYMYSGHSRLLAVKLAISEGAPIERVPMTVSQEGLSQDDMNVALIRGNEHKKLTYYESAVVVLRLSKAGFTIEEIARRSGITVPLIKARLMLMSAPNLLREKVANEIVSATLAIEMIAAHGGNKALEKIEEAQASATDSGKVRVTKAQTAPNDVFQRAKVVKKAAPKLYEAAGIVQSDPCYASLSTATRELLDALLAELKGNPDQGPTVDPRQKDIAEIL